MTAVLAPPPRPASSPLAAPLPWRKRPIWNRFSPMQLLVMTIATIAPMVISGAIISGLLGLATVEQMTEIALVAGENPGMITFGAMFLASPIQWATGRSQVRVRKYLGIVFFLLALSNGAMFIVERGIGDVLSSGLVIAGAIALALATPLFATSSRWSQRTLGMKNWRLLHKLTYVVAAALLAHVILINDIGPGAVMITLGFIARVPSVQQRLQQRGKTDQAQI